jgi:type I restriction enzyme M protein
MSKKKDGRLRRERGTNSVVEQYTLRYLKELGYRYIATDVDVLLGTRTIEADAVVYLDEGFSKPFIVVEAKGTLPKETTILEPAVQQAFAVATALGENVRYLLVTDGIRHEWYERSIQNQSLEKIPHAPTDGQQKAPTLRLESRLRPVADSETYLELLQSIVDILRNEGLVIGLRMGIEINRILIAKLRDERVIASGGETRFHAHELSAERTADDVRALYYEAIAELGSLPKEEGIWSISPRALHSVVRLLEPYSLHSVSRSVRDRSFWRIFPNLLRQDEWLHITPPPLAELLIHLVKPTKSESVIDPACGTGLLLLEALDFIETQASDDPTTLSCADVCDRSQVHNLTGIELNAEVAELAETNFALNGIPPRQIINANTLHPWSAEEPALKIGNSDVVVLNPPVGTVSKAEVLAYESAVPRTTHKISLEALFVERAVELLRDGGRLAVLVPDTFLISPAQEGIRAWLLRHTTMRIIISLPPESFMPVGHAGKATVLLLEKRRPKDAQEQILVADVQAVGYDRFGRPTRENDLPQLVELINKFQEGAHFTLQDDSTKSGVKRMRVWKVHVSDLSESGFGLSRLDPKGSDVIHALTRGRYPTVRIEEVADLISGRNFRTYVEQSPDAAILIQAGAVREAKIILTNSPYISIEDYWMAKRAHLTTGDVLVTTTGAYLGRAAVVEELPQPAAASGAVTILRSGPEIDAYFLAAVLNSVIGREQIARLQAATTAQPYIRRNDLGQLIIPLPSLTHQRALASRVTEMITTARELSERARALETEARETVVSELLKSSEHE